MLAGAYIAGMSERRTHWDNVYTTKTPETVSWRQGEPTLSLALIARVGVTHEAAILDVGAGATLLIDRLLDLRFTDVSALDVSEAAFERVRTRLGDCAHKVTWHVADVTRWRPAKRYALWHDRAVLHFLTTPEDQAAYGAVLSEALAPGGFAIISGFAPGGPEKCSGLPIVQHDAESLPRILGPEFTLRGVEDEMHITPAGGQQAFRYHVFQKAR